MYIFSIGVFIFGEVLIIISINIFIALICTISINITIIFIVVVVVVVVIVVIVISNSTLIDRVYSPLIEQDNKDNVIAKARNAM